MYLTIAHCLNLNLQAPRKSGSGAGGGGGGDGVRSTGRSLRPEALRHAPTYKEDFERKMNAPQLLKSTATIPSSAASAYYFFSGFISILSRSRRGFAGL